MGWGEGRGGGGLYLAVLLRVRSGEDGSSSSGRCRFLDPLGLRNPARMARMKLSKSGPGGKAA